MRIDFTDCCVHMISASQFDDFLLTNNTLLTHKVSRSCPNEYYCEKSDTHITRYETTSEHIIGCLKLTDFFFFTHTEELIDVNRGRVKEILEYHDDIEGYVGDVSIADEIRRLAKEQHECESLPHLLAIYPTALRQHLSDVDAEFRKKETPESLFAHAIDKLQPIIYCAQEKYRDARHVRGEDTGELLFTVAKTRRRSGPSFLPFPIINAYFEKLLVKMKDEGYFLDR